MAAEILRQAAEFLRQLPKVPAEDLEDKTCFICFEDFGSTPTENGALDEPVRTPVSYYLAPLCCLFVPCSKAVWCD